MERWPRIGIRTSHGCVRTTWLPPVSSHLASAGAGPERYAAVVNPPGRGKREIQKLLPPTVCYGALDLPVGGTFHFKNLVMPPLTKTCPKMVLSHKGVAFV